ncbi:MAG: hypothetical protein DRQ02_12515, partial [Candidatus Latescibacterota bacterium]
MCDIWKKPPGEEMSLEKIRDAFAQIPAIKTVRLTGGEPFSRKDLPAIVEIIKKYTATELIHITTNGLLPETITEFIKNSSCKGIHIKVSLTGYMEHHDQTLQYPGAYQKAIETIETLKRLQNKYNFVLGVNHTITDRISYADSEKIRKVCEKYNLPYLPVIAYQSVDLYQEKHTSTGNKSTSFQCYGNFTENELKIILKDLIDSTRNIDNLIEKIVKRYYLIGLYNRLILKRSFPSPQCVALRNHIRILPN